MLTTTLPSLKSASPLSAQLSRAIALCDAPITAPICREDIEAQTTVVTPEQLREFCEYLDRQFPLESAALMAGMVHPNFKGEAINYLTGEPLNDSKLPAIGYSCTAAALAAYRGCLSLFQNGEISLDTFREIVGATWTYNSAKAFEIARAESEAELLKLIGAHVGQLGPTFGKLVLASVKSARCEVPSEVADEVKIKLTKSVAVASTLMGLRADGESVAQALNDGRTSPEVVAWITDLEKTDADFNWAQLSELVSDKLSEIAAALAKTPLTATIGKAYDRKAYQEVSLRLEQQNLVVDPRLLYILEHARENTGHGSLKTILRIFSQDGQFSPANFSIIAQHLWSDMTATNMATYESRFVTPLGKMELGGFRGDLAHLGIRGYPWMLREGVGVRTSGAELIIEDIRDVESYTGVAAATFFGLQHRLGNACAFVIADAIRPGQFGNETEAAQFMQDFLNEPLAGLQLINLS